MAWSDWLMIVVALLVGFAAGWAIRGRRDGQASTVDAGPATATVREPVPAATTGTARPDATVDPAPTSVADPVQDSTTAGRADEPAPVPAADPVDADMALTGDPVPAADHTDPVTGTADDKATAALAAGPTGSAEQPAADEADGLAIAPRPAPDAEVETRDDEPARAATGEPAAETAPEPVAQPATREPVVEVPAEPVAQPEPGAQPENEPEPVTVPEPVAVPEAVAVLAARGTGATSPVGSEVDAETADDFRRIQGVGPKMAAALQAAGIRTYQQLAELDESALRETIRNAGLRAAPGLATWPQQARVLAGAPEAAAALSAGSERV